MTFQIICPRTKINFNGRRQTRLKLQTFLNTRLLITTKTNKQQIIIHRKTTSFPGRETCNIFSDKQEALRDIFPYTVDSIIVDSQYHIGLNNVTVGLQYTEGRVRYKQFFIILYFA